MTDDRILYSVLQQRLHDEALEKVDQDCGAFAEKHVVAGNDSLKDLPREVVACHAGGAR